ncbi:hypothetical protein A2631_02875 [Candidatus Daviesbacteria bacterium RIFCSPHIGHO2_01_FULL_44_29]|uniref:Methyltransferase type 11 domain-containing protein n=1 Tax=Candidatus Daviesbacteria bacterium RIFCSPHIGHO2_02_FULL_43_12 TaxID=1797776 RepID=A0A1F5KK65_9BACT|nr:MAG: hypothetical protein A2631_02875 [Candidatus Daviesbacteria bacterium RIFCSPHIGHO2_01_FULL_44_29]OGE40820.1 MAG: hypothetical protein A3E86_02475 [Candidatus Daviesbacteria bacterium RIFCSPHIGHO2_12_FULL_47_45]OGE41327.1 MAG: hypothetical protein A3D25_02270 [Candidatus Daviesbacteria bacterium RIFCSPHIGHO2_02_FULL_43_12]OGE69528.1 MAG: hypothetical protein A3B55_04010 [Candidatus Daviesbacteria bacterium RIFCSPLOWO2_01_FULL_43_15]
MKVTDNYQKYTHKNPFQRILLNNFFKALSQILRPLRVETILDVGCGEGFILAKLKQEKIGKKLIGIDLSKAALRIGKNIHPKLTLKLGSIYKLPFKDNAFDLVLCTEVLEHLKNPPKALAEIIRVSGRYIFLSVPNEPFFIAANLIRGKNVWRLGNDIGHINHWTSGGFEEFILKQGLKKLVKKHPFPWTIILAEKLKR